MAWTAPKTWDYREEILAADMQAQVAGNTQWLYERYYEAVSSLAVADETDATDYTGASAKKTMVTFTQLTIAETTVFELLYNTSLGHSATRDIFLDGFVTPSIGTAYYVTSGTSTKPTAASKTNIPAATFTTIDFQQRFSLAAGTYTISIVLWIVGGTGTLTRYYANSREMGLLRVVY